MQFGVCGDVRTAAVAARASYDFAEWSVPALLKPRESEDAFVAGLGELRSAGLPYPVANCFVPGDLKITGPEVDTPALRAYVTETMERAERAGVEVIVFGSGGARRIPEGFDPQSAHDQLVAFCGMVAPLAHDHGVVVVVEPLNTADCNVTRFFRALADAHYNGRVSIEAKITDPLIELPVALATLRRLVAVAMNSHSHKATGVDAQKLPPQGRRREKS
jgi:sugar phosphate isomerase/epimerase